MSLNSNWSLLSKLVRKTMKVLEKKSITHAEAFLTSTQITEVTIRNSQIHTQNRVDDSGVGFRVVVSGNKVGFACTNTLNEKTVVETGEKALAIARMSSEVPNFTLPKAGKPPKVNNLFDPRVAEIGVEEGVEIARRAVAAAEGFDKRVIAKDGRVQFETAWRGVINTLGVDFEENETKATIYLGGSGEAKGEVTGSCYDFRFQRTADLHPEQVGETMSKMIIDQFKPQPLQSFQGPVIFGPEAVANQLFIVLVDGLKGEHIVAKRSPWTEKLGEMVAAKKLTITDNAILEGGFHSRSFDDEGSPSQKSTLLENGQVASFLHNATSANALNTTNTGNASRYPPGFDMVRSIVGTGYRTKPEIFPSNFIIQPGKKTKDELVAEMEKGVLVESMAGFAQPGSGIISAQLTRAFYIQNGERQYPIKGGMVSGNAFEWFKQISNISKDCKQIMNAVAPSLQVEKVKLVGS